MYEYDKLDSIRIRALRAVWKPNAESIIRRIFRWYSREFSTPLHLVDMLPLDFVLMHWFEDQYEKLEVEEKHNLAIYLLETPDERRRRELEEKKADEDFFLAAKLQAENSKSKKILLDKLKELKDKVKNIKKVEVPPSPVVAGEADEIITISYSDTNLNNTDEDEDSLPIPPPLKKK